MRSVDQTGTLPAKSIVFAISKKHAYRIQEAFDTLYPEYKGLLARTIVSEDSRADELIKAFTTESMPRVAISVDMLDTGIDVPEGLQPGLCQARFLEDQVLADARAGDPGEQRMRASRMAAKRDKGVFPGL